ncbi:UPF0613 protein [Yarrowia sp. C11]|nr:UPF0613 protein [Yarrowia sp. E02]KAG5371618.1 UPF0613 protein [Yarrowia sp. C11]
MNPKYVGNAYTGATVHKYYANLIGIEHPTRSGVPHTNTVVFIGGLADAVTNVPYVKPLADALDKSGWGVVELLISSSLAGWEPESKEQDATEIEMAVKYLTTKLKDGGLPNKQKIVLLGHAVGCLDIMHYLTSTRDLEESFEKINVPLLFLMNGQRGRLGYQQKILDRYEDLVKCGYWSKLSGVVDGASQNVGRLSKEGAVDVLVEKVKGFVRGI